MKSRLVMVFPRGSGKTTMVNTFNIALEQARFIKERCVKVNKIKNSTFLFKAISSKRLAYIDSETGLLQFLTNPAICLHDVNDFAQKTDLYYIRDEQKATGSQITQVWFDEADDVAKGFNPCEEFMKKQNDLIAQAIERTFRKGASAADVPYEKLFGIVPPKSNAADGENKPVNVKVYLDGKEITDAPSGTELPPKGYFGVDMGSGDITGILSVKMVDGKQQGATESKLMTSDQIDEFCRQIRDYAALAEEAKMAMPQPKIPAPPYGFSGKSIVNELRQHRWWHDFGPVHATNCPCRVTPIKQYTGKAEFTDLISIAALPVGKYAVKLKPEAATKKFGSIVVACLVKCRGERKLIRGQDTFNRSYTKSVFDNLRGIDPENIAQILLLEKGDE